MSALAIIHVGRPRLSDLEAEAAALDVWFGPTLYAGFLRKHGQRPDPSQAETIGKLMGTKVQADDGRKYPRTSRRTA